MKFVSQCLLVAKSTSTNDATNLIRYRVILNSVRSKNVAGKYFASTYLGK